MNIGRIRVLAAAVAMVALAAAFFSSGTPAKAVLVITFDGSPGEGAPPATLGPYTMTAFAAEDSRGNNTNVTNVPSPISGDVGFDQSAQIRQIGAGWGGSQASGFTGDAYCFKTVTCSSASSSQAVLTMPAGTVAFYFYAAPNLAGAADFTVTAETGATSVSSGAVTVDHFNEARFFGFYATGGVIETITIELEAGVDGFAIMQMGIAFASCSTTNVCYVNAATGSDSNTGLNADEALATIQEAESRTTDGGRIIVAPGTYSGTIIIDHGVSLEGPNIGKAGNDPTRTAEASIGDGVTVDANVIVSSTADVTIDGFQVYPTFQVFAVSVENSNHVVVRNNRLIQGQLASAGSSDVVFQRNYVLGSASYGIRVRDSSNVDVLDNIVEGTAGADEPISVEVSSNVDILRNRVIGPTCQDCVAALLLADVLNVLVAENELQGSGNFLSAGDVVLLLGASSNISIRNNVLEALNSAGFLIYLTGNQTNVSINENHLGDTSSQFALADGIPEAVNAERNWWGDPSGPDFNNSGPGTGTEIGDIVGPGTVDFDPWLCRGDDLSPAIGFQPAVSLSYYLSPCDTTKPVWNVTFRERNGPVYDTAAHPWTNRQVDMILTCSDPGPNASGVLVMMGDRSATFGEGQWTTIPAWKEGNVKGDAPNEHCYDRAGNQADPIQLLPAGHAVWVDLTSPVCKPSTSTVYLKKNSSSNHVVVNIKGTEPRSGIDYGESSISVQSSYGANYIDALFSSNDPHPTNLAVELTDVSMPNSTKAQLKVTVNLEDQAGNRSSCTFYVKAK